MIHNSWKARLCFGLVMWASGACHHALVAGVSNTPQGMLMYHSTAALVDLMLLCCAPSVLYGRLADDMQNTCMLSIAINAAGWFLYLAYAPPNSYNLAIEVLGYVQYARLFITGFHGFDRAGGFILRGHAFGR